jgi:hypothetical protein
MNRITVVIGAMKPMTAGHYNLIRKAVLDDERPEGVEKADETFVLISGQDRLRKGEFPMYGDAAMQALKDYYINSEKFLNFVPPSHKINFIVTYSNKFAAANPERIKALIGLIDDLNYLIKNRVQNASFDYEQVKSGPPNVLYSLLNSNDPHYQSSQFILYTGLDDVEKYRKQKYLFRSGNLEIAGFERTGGGVSGTETRRLMALSPDEMTSQESERFGTVFPDIDLDIPGIRNFYRKRAGLEERLLRIITEAKIRRYEMGTNEYSLYIDDIIGELQYVKGSFESRKKLGKRYRKEASRIQDAISVLRGVKRKNNKKIDNALLSERLVRSVAHDNDEIEAQEFNRDTIKNFFKKFR